MTDYLFAYGFLKRKFYGNEKTQTPDFKADFIAEGQYPGLLYRVDVYPGVIYSANGPKVIGEVYRLKQPEITLRMLDRYENAKPLVLLNADYERKIRPIETQLGQLKCWVYEYIKPINPATLIDSGEFL